ncbi:uncharacterized protein LOC128626559 [Artibeus jamaicensis]|uniref:uncharacterized protein LOC128626559 n=1 Tax=Artibeus jamaicensis TaxID=9417 RepID=UPI00235AE555|nr:uncharacterized protein LOC128626559 [Artibeus jamaicensis]
MFLSRKQGSWGELASRLPRATRAGGAGRAGGSARLRSARRAAGALAGAALGGSQSQSRARGLGPGAEPGRARRGGAGTPRTRVRTPPGAVWTRHPQTGTVWTPRLHTLTWTGDSFSVSVPRGRGRRQASCLQGKPRQAPDPGSRGPDFPGRTRELAKQEDRSPESPARPSTASKTPSRGNSVHCAPACTAWCRGLRAALPPGSLLSSPAEKATAGSPSTRGQGPGRVAGHVG